MVSDDHWITAGLQERPLPVPGTLPVDRTKLCVSIRALISYLFIIGFLLSEGMVRL
jgi:hypothetical protein